MPILDFLLPEIDHEARTTARVLERVPDDRLDWTPHPKSMPLRKLAWHIAKIPTRVMQMLQEATFDMAKAGPFPPPENAGSIVAGYHESLAELRAYLVTLDDAALKEPFTLVRDGQTIMTIPKVAVIRNILMNHTYHHRGQLSVYLRLLDVPVPSIYGPTADERG
ncbi:MAG TPA: DinB family protein [Thermoanaerobaculia bacterium]|nr:DinB family protein [Thermoanaerobaculia bacterium]